jgi:hypothetical protein
LYLSYSTIAARAALSCDEAVALCLAAAHASDGSLAPDAWRPLPSAADIHLRPDGAVEMPGYAGTVTGRERTRQITALLRLLLGLDDEPWGRSRADVPGALLLLMARATGQIDLPAPPPAELCEALRRFAPMDASMLPAIHQRLVPPPVAAPRRSRAADFIAASLVAVAALAAFLTVVALGRRVQDRGPASPAVADAAAVASAATPVAQEVEARRGPAVVAAGDTPASASALEARARPLLSAAQVGADVFSPSFTESRGLLFHAGRDRSALMRASFDASGRPAVETVLSDGAANYHAVPSPDGRWLAFDSDRDGTRGVYVAGPDAAGARRISGAGYAAVPRWSPDGQRLAFIRADPAQTGVWNVWVADVESGVFQQVSHHRVGQAWGPSWFPDGQRLAYSVEDALIVSDLRDGSARVIPSPRKGRLVRTPAVSPDGHWIVFQVYGDGVWLLDIRTGRTRRLLADLSAEEFAWAPDGGRIVYHTRRGGGWAVWQLSFS